MNKSLFFKWFPVPSVMGVDEVGIDISDTDVHFVKLSSGGTEIKLNKFGSYPLPEGVFSGGKILKADFLRGVLMSMKKEHGISFANVAIPDEQSYLVETETFSSNDSEIRESLDLHIEENIPIKSSEAIFDYEVEEKTSNEGSKKVILTAVQAGVVSSYVELFSSAGITVTSLETRAQAVCRCVVPYKNSDTVMLVNIGFETTGIYVIDGETVHFVSDADMGSKDFLLAIEKELKITQEEVKNVIKLFCNGSYDSAQKENIYSAIASIFGDLSEEVNRHFLYWHSRKDAKGRTKSKITKIIICGSDSSSLGLVERLASNLRVPAEMANVWINVFSFEKYIPPMSCCESLQYSTAIGLALYSINKK